MPHPEDFPWLSPNSATTNENTRALQAPKQQTHGPFLRTTLFATLGSDMWSDEALDRYWTINETDLFPWYLTDISDFVVDLHPIDIKLNTNSETRISLDIASNCRTYPYNIRCIGYGWEHYDSIPIMTGKCPLVTQPICYVNFVKEGIQRSAKLQIFIHETELCPEKIRISFCASVQPMIMRWSAVKG